MRECCANKGYQFVRLSCLCSDKWHLKLIYRAVCLPPDLEQVPASDQSLYWDLILENTGASLAISLYLTRIYPHIPVPVYYLHIHIPVGIYVLNEALPGHSGLCSRGDESRHSKAGISAWGLYSVLECFTGTQLGHFTTIRQIQNTRPPQIFQKNVCKVLHW